MPRFRQIRDLFLILLLYIPSAASELMLRCMFWPNQIRMRMRFSKFHADTSRRLGLKHTGVDPLKNVADKAEMFRHQRHRRGARR